MKKKNAFAKLKTMKKVAALCVVLILTACSSDGGGDDSSDDNGLDLTAVEGRYVGTFSWPLGTGPISMILTNLGSNRYSVDYYESGDFRPLHNSDGVTPEGKGFIEIDGNNATFDINILTDQPPCSGDYVGDGTRTDDGKFTFVVFVSETCVSVEDDATLTFTKIGN